MGLQELNLRDPHTRTLPLTQGVGLLSFLVVYIIEKCRGDTMNDTEIAIDKKKAELQKLKK